MTWDHPGLLAASLALPLVVLLHLLARRRRNLVVPSLLLWERLLENERRSVYLRRLIADILLFLQLFTAGLLVLALAGPRFEGGNYRITGPTVLVLDVSAGMSARGDGESGKKISRYETAVKEAGALIRRKNSRAEVMLVAGGREALPVTGFLTSRNDLLNALKKIVPTDETGNPRRVLRAAESLAAGKGDGKVFFITDGAFDDGPMIGEGTTVVPVGGVAENVGITAFAVRNLQGGGREALLVLENHGPDIRRVGLTVKVDGRDLYQDILVLEPDSRGYRTVSWNDPLAGEVTAFLDFPESGGWIDALDSDNRVFGVLTPGGRIRTALYTPGNWFLETLLAAHPNLSLTVIRDEESPGAAGSSGDYASPEDGSWDLVVADRIYLETPDDVPLLAIFPFAGNRQPDLPLGPRGLMNDAEPLFRDPGHPITRNLDLTRVSIRSALLVAAGPEARTVVSSADGPLVLAGENARRRWVAFTFDLLDSSLPLRPGFPILISGVIDWLTTGNPDNAAESRSTGDLWAIPVGMRISDWLAEAPDGRIIRGDDGPGGYSVRLDRVGFWTVESGGKKVRTGVNLVNSGESDLRHRWNPGGKGETLESAAGKSSEIRHVTPARATGPATAWLLILALLTVLVEWGFQTRYWRKG